MHGNATKTRQHDAGVWIDHRQAWIVVLSPDGDTVKVMHSNIEKHPERGGDSPLKGSYEARQVPADDSRQRALTGELNLYYDAVGAVLRDCSRFLIMGPGEAKGELHTRLVRMKIGDRIAAVHTEGQMTERQVVASVREYFVGAAPRMQAPQHP